MKVCLGLRDGVKFFQIKWSQFLGCPSGNMVTTETTLNYHFTVINTDAKLHRNDCITKPTVTVVVVRTGILEISGSNSRQT
jgi:hypothetical protein